MGVPVLFYANLFVCAAGLVAFPCSNIMRLRFEVKRCSAVSSEYCLALLEIKFLRILF